LAVKKEFKDADLVVISDAGHAVSIEKPKEFNAT
jgi:pimeloyl-ACP methyl ester carboxylesterase